MSATLLAVIDVQTGCLKPHMADLPSRIARFVAEGRARGGDVA